MYLKRPRLWITIVVLLEIISIIVGCTPTDLPPTTAQIEPQNTGTLSVTDQTEPTLEPSPMLTTPVLKPLTTEVPPSDVPNPTADPVSLLNPGFENQETNGIPSGWNHTGAAGASFIENRGHSSDSRLTHQSSEAYQVETWQTISGLENDWYTLRAWARSSGGQKAVYIALKCGNDERRVHIPSTLPGYRWIQLAVSNQVMDDQCTISLYSDGNPDTWASFDDIELVPGRSSALHSWGRHIEFEEVRRHGRGLQRRGWNGGGRLTNPQGSRSELRSPAGLGGSGRWLPR